jgi:hypothetical protein
MNRRWLRDRAHRRWWREREEMNEAEAALSAFADEERTALYARLREHDRHGAQCGWDVNTPPGAITLVWTGTPDELNKRAAALKAGTAEINASATSGHDATGRLRALVKILAPTRAREGATFTRRSRGGQARTRRAVHGRPAKANAPPDPEGEPAEPPPPAEPHGRGDEQHDGGER